MTDRTSLVERLREPIDMELRKAEEFYNEERAEAAQVLVDAQKEIDFLNEQLR
jgi:hypothetical protein